MKEMENNDFVHTLDAVYNLCSEIKEHITSIETTDEEENNEGLILLSDNLQRLQAEIAGMKSQLSAGRNEWEQFRELTLVRVKEMHNLYANLCAINKDIFSEQERIANELQRIQQLEVHHTNNHILDFKASRPFLWQVVMFGIILLLLVGNACQFKRNMQLSDNDLKYRFIKMKGRATGNDLDTLEAVFTRNRSKEVIGNIRNVVEDFEYRTRVRTEKLERARLLQQEAQELIQ